MSVYDKSCKVVSIVHLLDRYYQLFTLVTPQLSGRDIAGQKGLPPAGFKFSQYSLLALALTQGLVCILVAASINKDYQEIYDTSLDLVNEVLGGFKDCGQI